MLRYCGLTHCIRSIKIADTILGHHKRDSLQAPIVKNDSRLKILRRGSDLITSWSNCRRPGMTSETSLAWTQTLRATADLAEDLENYNFNYFLPGKVLSDVREARFGCYRQMSGANYFMSVRQLLDSEKKIRVMSKLQDLKTAFSCGPNVAIESLEEVLPESQDRTINEGNFQWFPTSADSRNRFLIPQSVAV